MALKCEGKLWMGPGTHEVPMELFELNRQRLVEKLREKEQLGNAVVLLQGGSEISFYDTDTTYIFRQESYFMWLFGVTEADCYGAVEVQSGAVHLFVPHLPPSYSVWMGPLLSLEDYSKKYKIPNVHYVEDIASVLKGLNPTVLLTLKGVNTDSGLTAKEANFEGIEKFTVDNAILFPIIADLRVFKTDLELEVLRYVISVSSRAHRAVMRFAKPGKSEYQCESVFLDSIYRLGGCRHVSYTCICGSGPNGAILHYGHAGAPNDRFVKDGDLCLFDMGGNYFGYAADITCTFPANGKFTPDQKLIYEAVLKANLGVAEAAKPGTSWIDMHLLANKILLEELKIGGLLKGDVDDMMDAGLGAVFQPHGLGHLMGLDVHDVGGYLKGQPERSHAVRGLDRLRTARTLQERMVLTIEPGCYFIDSLLGEALADPKMAKFLVPEVIQRFRGFGGVRIEDDVLITASGVENLTKVPRTVQEIEEYIANGDESKYE